MTLCSSTIYQYECRGFPANAALAAERNARQRAWPDTALACLR